MQGAGVPVDYVCSQKVGKVTSVYSWIFQYTLCVSWLPQYTLWIPQYTLCISLDTQYTLCISQYTLCILSVYLWILQAQVYSEDGVHWDSMLNQTNLKNNNNKFYLLQLLKDNTSGHYSTWFRWGRGDETRTHTHACTHTHTHTVSLTVQV